MFMILKNFFKRFKDEFAGKAHEASGAGIAGGQGTGELSPEERRRRLELAAELTVKEYGSVIERLAKE